MHTIFGHYIYKLFFNLNFPPLFYHYLTDSHINSPDNGRNSFCLSHFLEFLSQRTKDFPNICQFLRKFLSLVVDFNTIVLNSKDNKNLLSDL